MLYWLARLPSILLQLAWEPKWQWAQYRRPREPWVRLYVGPDMMQGAGWVFSFMLFPRRDLMGRHEEGHLILAALHFQARFRWRVLGRLRPGVSVWAISDTREIADRIAQRAGQLA